MFKFETIFFVEANMFNWQINFQNPTTGIMAGIIDLHNHIFFFLTTTLIFVCWMLNVICKISIYPQVIATVDKFKEQLFVYKRIKHFYNKNITHNSLLEIVWTLTPSVILIFIALPSFALLYAIDQVILPELTLKVIGHQWYWSYEYGDDFSYIFKKNALPTNHVDFDCYMKPLGSDNLKVSATEIPEVRLLSTDRKVPLPVDTRIRVIVTSADVIHSWCIPEFGVKIDAVPGRLNEVFFKIGIEGACFGQCSEICGVNHLAMPIEIVKCSPEDFQQWYNYTQWSQIEDSNIVTNMDFLSDKQAMKHAVKYHDLDVSETYEILLNSDHNVYIIKGKRYTNAHKVIGIFLGNKTEGKTYKQFIHDMYNCNTEGHPVVPLIKQFWCLKIHEHPANECVYFERWFDAITKRAFGDINKSGVWYIPPEMAAATFDIK
jgi:cytochrome c oxidase subunit 2